MGCCENKSIQTDFLLFPEKHIEIERPSFGNNCSGSFDDVRIHSEEENLKNYTDTSQIAPSSFNNTFNTIELAFLLTGTLNKSKPTSLLIPADGF